jgi:hypothetical protein
MYVLGGYDGREFLQRVLKYGWAAVCVVDSDIYVIGGQNNDDVGHFTCEDVYKYNVVNNVWSLGVAYARCSSALPSLPAGRYDLRCGRIWHR